MTVSRGDLVQAGRVACHSTPGLDFFSSLLAMVQSLLFSVDPWGAQLGCSCEFAAMGSPHSVRSCRLGGARPAFDPQRSLDVAPPR